MRRAPWALALGVVVACGAKSGLYAPAPEAGAVDAGPPDVVSEPPPEPPDASVDAVPDVVPPSGCDDAGANYIHVITEQSLLYRFDPSNASFIHVGTIFCQSASSPFSMAVTRNGTAYVLFHDGKLYEVNTQNAACKLTSFVPNQLGWLRFGMGFVADPGGFGDTLYVTDSSYAHPSLGLATLDTKTSKLAFVGPYSQNLGDAVELTGTGDGRLFAFGLPTSQQSATLAEVDEASGQVLSSLPLPLGKENSSFAFAAWGGDFYFFIAPGAAQATEVTRYRPSEGTLQVVAKHSTTVVGAGVSTCAPF